jgi:hypothetical protein
VNEVITQGIAGVNRLLGVDAAVLYPYFGGFRIFGWNSSEDLAGNLLHTWLGLAAVVVLIAGWRRFSRLERIMAAGFLAAVLLFVLGVRWQLFIARLHTPMVILLAPCLLLLIDRRWPRVASASVLVALLLALPALLRNPTRSLLSGGGEAGSILTIERQAGYFARRPERYAAYGRTVAILTNLGCRRVGLVAGYDSWEYPLWALGRASALRFEHLPPVGDPEPASSPAPCAVVGLDQPSGWRPAQAGVQAELLFAGGPIAVWR